LDITAQARIREFLGEYNRRTGATILLTSHYMADVTSLCERIIIIHQGQLKYDGGLTDLSHKIAPYKVIGVALGEVKECDLSCYGELVQSENGNGKQYIQVKSEEVMQITASILQDLPVHDLTIEDPPIESVIERAFND
jgi:ABC-2 type transport system ATP-binding protein